MSALTAIVILRLGAFIVGCIAYGVANYMGWPHAGWLLVPTIIAGTLCSSLMIDSDAEKKPAHSGRGS